MSNELKPCPFCGGKEVIYSTYNGKPEGFGYIRCSNCGAIMNDIIDGVDIIRAEKLWNNRTDERPKDNG